MACLENVCEPNISCNGKAVCQACNLPILEQFLLKVCENFWHENCLRCSYCGVTLNRSISCFVRDGKIFCKEDYKSIYGAKCYRCGLPLDPKDLVHRSVQGIYHATCFLCIFCGQILQPGDEYVLHEGYLVCKPDYEAMMQNAYGPNFKLLPSLHSDHRKSPKRPRTILTSQQRKVFKASFELSAKPCRKVRESLAKDTGLSVRVVQVWFQNQRAKMKKIQRKQEQNQKSKKSKNSANAADRKTRRDQNSTSNEDPETSRPDSTSSTCSTGDSSEISCQSPINDSFDKNYPEADDDDTAVNMNPIDRLYSMQNSYFSS